MVDVLGSEGVGLARSRASARVGFEQEADREELLEAVFDEVISRDYRQSVEAT